MLDNLGNDGTKRFLTQKNVHIRNFLRNILVYDDSTCGSLYELITL